ncbi:MAG: HIT family protein [Flavobacteriales bacterium]|nr:HIT family protein [Flavobacteriales bacterium]
MSTIFSKIIAKEIPSYFIAETTSCFAFHDIMPLAVGHVLVVPKLEVDYIFDLDDDLLSELNVFAKKVAKAIEKAVPCERVGIAVIGLEVPHAHIHLIPLNSVEDINFSRPRLKLSSEELEDISRKIKRKLGN